MKTYILQIHNDVSAEMDEIYIFANFQNLCAEFAKKVNFYKNCGIEFRALEEPTDDDATNEAHGMFDVENADGSKTTGKVYDYHILDED